MCRPRCRRSCCGCWCRRCSTASSPCSRRLRSSGSARRRTISARASRKNWQLLEKPLSILRDVRNALLPSSGSHDVGFDIVGIVQPAVSLLTPALAQIVIFFAALFFMLLGRVRLRRELIGFFDAREQRLRALRIMHEDRAQYFRVSEHGDDDQYRRRRRRRADRMDCRIAAAERLGGAWIRAEFRPLSSAR